MCQLIKCMQIIESCSAVNAECTPIHCFGVLIELDWVSWWCSWCLVRFNKLSKWNLNRCNLSTSFSFALIFLTLIWFVWWWVNVNSCLRFLNVFPAHQVILIKVLTNIYQVVRLVEAVDVDHLHTQFLGNLILWLRVQRDTLAYWKVWADRAFEFVINLEVNEEIKFNREPRLTISSVFICIVWTWCDPRQHYRDVTLSIKRLNNQRSRRIRVWQVVNVRVHVVTRWFRHGWLDELRNHFGVWHRYKTILVWEHINGILWFLWA